MQSNDARMLLHCAVPTAVAGVVAAAISGVFAGGKGAIGGAAGALVVILFMGLGLYVLQRTARSFPHLFQAMGLLLYTTQILLLFVVLVVFRDTTLFDTKTFAFTLLGSTVVWVAAQGRAHMKAKILYVEPSSGGSEKASAT
ncbi:hypothetical protein ABZ820_16025 [Streptomyces diacarni]|uniref:ATP synthase protein I n=1 Tax=Streptomyces diacarni TaxID=2800381 RepID=A0A367ENM5_9ACTN|nr:hypothetical protein [Streptomyces diacarni]RCG19674.1 hypothetical protein DTL70_23395 [Streptomyces diacarni]